MAVPFALTALLLLTAPVAASARLQPDRASASALAARAAAQADAGNIAGAISILEQAEQEAPDWPELKVNLAALKSQAGDYAGAIRAARAALQLSPALEGARFNLGLAQLKSGDAAGAAATLEPYADRSDVPPSVHAALGLALDRLGRTTDAASALQRSVDAGLRDPESLLALGTVRLRLEEVDRAAATLTMLKAVAPGSIDVWLLEGDVKDARSDWSGAEAAYRAAAALASDGPRATYSLGLVLYKQRRYDEAAAVFDETLTTAPAYTPALYYRGVLEMDRGRAGAAVPFLERLCRDAPDRADGWRELGRARLDLGHANAVAALERAVALGPSDPSAYFLLGRALQKAGRSSEAQAAFARAASLNEQQRDELRRRVSGRKKRI